MAIDRNDSGDGLGITDPEELDPVKKELQKQKDLVIQKNKAIQSALETSQITPQFASLLQSIDTKSQGKAEGDLLKVELALADPHLFSHTDGQVVYVGSGVDWQFPVAIGARNITMLDVSFQNTALKERLVENVKAHARDITEEDGGITFSIDLGKGTEVVTLRMQDDDIQTYVPQEELGGVLESFGPTGHFTRGIVMPQVASSIKEGGIILSTRYSEEITGLRRLTVGKGNAYQVTNRDEFSKSTATMMKAPESKGLSLAALRARLQKPEGK